MLDAYTPCPGGSGKKIKFCCGDFLAELQKIDRMIEGEQYLACLKHIDRLLEQEPDRDRACLLAPKCALLRATEQYQAAKAAAATFLARHPDNQIALAESAMALSETDPKAALALVHRALRTAAGRLAHATYEAMGVTAGALLDAGLPVPGIALLQLQVDAHDDDEIANQMLTAVNRSTEIPLLLRVDSAPASCPDDASWKARFDAAIEPIGKGDWQTAAEQFDKLSAEVPDAPSVWKTLAVIRGELCDNDRAIAAWRKYAALRAAAPDGLDDAVEAEARAMFLAPDPLGDRVGILKIVFTVKDADRVQEAMSSSPTFRVVQVDPSQFTDGENPPPKAAATLLDRPMPASAEGLQLETLPRLLGQAMLFGRQTDREACLEVIGVAADEFTAARRAVLEAVGDAVEPAPQQEVIGHCSATRKILQADWKPPRDIKPEQLRLLFSEHHRDALLNRWPDVKLGILGGRSPRDAATDPALRVRVLAAILVVEHWASRMAGEVDFNELRARLGLPEQGLIDAKQTPIESLSSIRLARLDVETLSDEDLTKAYDQASAFAVLPAVRNFAKAIIERPSLEDADERLFAYAALARAEDDLNLAIEYVAEDRRHAESKKIGHTSWDLMELSFRFAQRNGAEAMRLVEHIQSRHIEEPGVGEALARMLLSVGLIRPDGSPTIEPEAEAMADAALDEPAGLWTPESAQPAAGGGKLWTPE
jgi:hypothetical protein